MSIEAEFVSKNHNDKSSKEEPVKKIEQKLKDYVPSSQQKEQLDCVLDVLKKSEENKLTTVVMAGYGLDGLFGQLTRDHGDLDMLVDDKDVDSFLKILSDNGWQKDANENIKEGDVYEFRHPNLPSSFKIEFGKLSQIKGFLNNEEDFDKYIPKENNAILQGIPFKSFTLEAHKWSTEIQNKRLDGTYPRDKIENKEMLFKVLEARQENTKRTEQIKVINELFKNAKHKDFPLYLFASFADDVLLNNGEIKESHGDIDAICLRTDVEKIKQTLKEIGCKNIEEERGNNNFYSEVLPLKITAQLKEFDIDIPILDFDNERQEPYYSITNNENKKYRIYFGKDFFSKTPIETTFGQLFTVSPLGLIQTRLFYPTLEGIKLREKDLKAAEALRNKFFPGENLSNKKFMPEIIEIKE